ncbi:nucleotidyltransferase family protein [Hirschia baltica]|uniref:Uncharacterized MobA-related protein n=1 Tax=Hirschia baltica (strain ATCC 49814 / DSM 5838 / IFAM 1418) TaxID=582402 RepID=C6XJ23_HIRBI|nr:nucleotidyltransferase family protein [Hirschia baltica]ACT59118.1 Uncharacterized MobA-related protein [Hirschia baltica ATCC 49814]
MTPPELTIVLLASGLSTRFLKGDKLLAEINAKTILEHTIESFSELSAVKKLAVVGSQQYQRSNLLKQKGWNIVENPNPELGQGHSIALAAIHIVTSKKPTDVLICLADMPLIPAHHFKKLKDARDEQAEIIYTQTDDYIGPPALFRAHLLPTLQLLTGDTGAKSILPANTQTKRIPLHSDLALDIDTEHDLNKMNQYLN